MLNDEDGFGAGFYAQRQWNEAWIKYVLEFPLPDVRDEGGVKEEIIGMLKPVMDTAAKSNILRREIPMHLDSYDLIWSKYFAYMKKGKYNARLLVLQESLREGFELHLNRGIEATQMRMIFEPKQTISQRFMNGMQKKVGWFKSRRDENEQNNNPEV